MKPGAKERLVGLEESDTDSDTDEGESNDEDEGEQDKGWESMEE
jgi:periodic tryptophan protein 1